VPTKAAAQTNIATDAPREMRNMISPPKNTEINSSREFMINQMEALELGYIPNGNNLLKCHSTDTASNQVVGLRELKAIPLADAD
jgi:hypothetical protein